MIGYWISFGIIFLLIPFGVVGMKRWVINNNSLSDKQIKTANFRAFLLILFYWLCDLFYMSCFIYNIWCQFIFGGLLMAIIFMNLAQGFSYPIKRTTFNKWGMLQDFIIGIGLTIYLIYRIPNETIQAITIPIVAAIYGGFITLIGVSWTIKKSDIDKANEEIRKARPLIFIVDHTREQVKNHINFAIGDFETTNKHFKNGTLYEFDNFVIKNSDFSYCAMKGFCLNEDVITMFIAQGLDKGTTYAYVGSETFMYDDEVKDVSLLLQDMLDNFYIYRTNFKIKTLANGCKCINILSGIEFKKVEVYENYTFKEVSENA